MFTTILNKIDDIVWGIPTIILILATGILLTIRLRGVQFTKLGLGIKNLFKKVLTRSFEKWYTNVAIV